MKSVLWRVVKRLSNIEDARCLKINAGHRPTFCTATRPVHFAQINLSHPLSATHLSWHHTALAISYSHSQNFDLFPTLYCLLQNPQNVFHSNTAIKPTNAYRIGLMHGHGLCEIVPSSVFSTNFLTIMDDSWVDNLR